MASLSMEIRSRLTRDGTAENASRDQILRRVRGRGIFIFPVQLTTSRIGNLTRLIRTLLHVMTIHTYIQDSPDPTIPPPPHSKKKLEIPKALPALDFQY